MVTATDTYLADVAIEGGKIVAIYQPGTFGAPGAGSAADDVVIDARGKYILPGGIDAHTHMEMPFGGTTASDDFETGTLAAAYGGTTSIVDFAIQSKGQALKQGLDAWHAKAEGQAAIDYAFHLIMTDVNEDIAEEMGDIVNEGVTSFKMFMAYPGVLLVDDGQIFRGMQRAGELGALICMHAENGLPIDVLVAQAIAKGNTSPKFHSITRPQIMEAEGTHRAICLAEMAGAPVYMVHLSAERALTQVVEARDRGLPVYAETCPQYLFLDDSDLARTDGPWGEFEGAKYIATPPLRPKSMQEDLWRGLRTHDLQVVSTDHCPFCMKGQKELGRGNFAKVPNGMPGVETRLYLLWDGGVRTGPDLDEPLRRDHQHRTGEDLRPLSQQGDHRHRRRRGPAGVGPGEAPRPVGQDAPHARRLLALRRAGGRRRADPRSLPRPRGHRERRVQGEEGRRAVREAGNVRVVSAPAATSVGGKFLRHGTPAFGRALPWSGAYLGLHHPTWPHVGQQLSGSSASPSRP